MLNRSDNNSAYRIVTDAAADLRRDFIEAHPEITVIPMDIAMDDRPFLYGPGGSISIEEFYAMQREGKNATTSQVNPAAYMDAFEKILEAGEDVLYLGFSSGMSAMYRNAEVAAEELMAAHPGRRVLCVDTRCAAPGEGFLVQLAMARRQEGLPIEELARWATEAREHICHWFTVDTFTYLQKGGRVSAAAAIVGTALQIKPLLRVDNNGLLEVMGRPRGKKRAMEAMMERLRQSWQPEVCDTVTVVHADCPDRAELLARRVTEEFPQAKIDTVPLGPVIGTHTGPGLMALVFWGTSR